MWEPSRGRVGRKGVLGAGGQGAGEAEAAFFSKRDKVQLRGLSRAFYGGRAGWEGGARGLLRVGYILFHEREMCR